jgi:hypothetical protein
MSEMRNALNAFHGNDLSELDLTVPLEKENAIKQKLHIKYGDFNDGCWTSEEKNKRVTLFSPTMTVDTARRMIKECPDYASVVIATVRPIGHEESVYEGPPTIPQDKYETLEKKVRRIEKRVKDRDFSK